MNKVNFGHKRVSVRHQQKLIKELFNTVATKYDIMNDLMSFGLHRLWKKHLINYIRKDKPRKILDLAGGTGDVGNSISEINKDSLIIIYDISINMLINSSLKKNSLNKKNITYVNGSAENLAIADNSLDCITLTFGLRNFSQPEKAIKECYRTLKYGGKIYCLEFSPSYSHRIKPLYDWYSHKIIPTIGRVVAKNEGAYTYLVESIRNFYHNPELVKIFNKNGFFCYNKKIFLGGIAYLNIFSKV